MKNILPLLLLVFTVSCTQKQNTTIHVKPNTSLLDSLVNNWHKAVANTDSSAYFGFMDSSFIFLGTEANERWNKLEFTSFSMPYFKKGKAWDFTPIERNWYFSKDLQTVWFEEKLETWMEECRGSGVLVKNGKEWKIAYYNLAVTIENEKMQEFIDLRKK
jgi:hypothetical protein